MSYFEPKDPTCRNCGQLRHAHVQKRDGNPPACPPQPVKLTWTVPLPGVYRSKCGRYDIEKLDNIVRGASAMWEIRGAGTVVQRKTLRAAKRYCELHAACNAR